MKKHMFFYLSLLSIFMVLILSGGAFAGRNLNEVEYKLLPFSVDSMGITVLYPDGWKVGKVDTTKGIIFKAESPDDYLYEIYRYKAGPDETLSEYTKSQGDWLEKNYENYKEVDVDEGEKIGDYTGNIRIYTYTYKDSVYEVAEFYFKDNDNFYIVLLDVPKGELDGLIPLFKSLVSGIKIAKPTFSFKEFTSPDSDFLIKYPANWKLYPSKEDMVFEVGDGKGVWIQVLVHKLSPDMDTEEYAKSSGKWLSKNLKDYKETRFEKFVKDNELKGYLRNYKYMDNEKTQYVEEYYFTYKLEDMNKGFTLVFVMPEDISSDYVEKLREMKEKILNSFSLIYG